MDTLRSIDIADYAGVSFVTQPGPVPQVQWIAISDLRIDDRYQRPIGQRGKIQVRRIAERFKWSRFAPIIVAPIEGGLFAIIDGQHRSHAAKLRGVKSVPCMVVNADTAEQAEAFVDVNTQQLAVVGAVLHKSRVVSGDVKAVEIQRICDAAGARIVTPRKQAELKRGDTFAAATLYKACDLYGADTLTRALEAIVKVGEGNIGMVRANVITAYCVVLGNDTALRDHPELLDVLDEFDLTAAFNRMTAARLDGGSSRFRILASAFEAFLRHNLRQPAEAA